MSCIKLTANWQVLVADATNLKQVHSNCMNNEEARSAATGALKIYCRYEVEAKARVMLNNRGFVSFLHLCGIHSYTERPSRPCSKILSTQCVQRSALAAMAATSPTRSSSSAGERTSNGTTRTGVCACCRRSPNLSALMHSVKARDDTTISTSTSANDAVLIIQSVRMDVVGLPSETHMVQHED